MPFIFEYDFEPECTVYVIQYVTKIYESVKEGKNEIYIMFQIQNHNGRHQKENGGSQVCHHFTKKIKINSKLL